MADADTVYRVMTYYSADTSSAKSEVGGFAVVLDHVMNLAKEAATFIHGVAEKIIDVGSEAEKAKISIAGMFEATGLSAGNGFNTALAMSSEMLKQMQKDAAALPGTFEELTDIFRRMIPGGANAGKSANQIEGMAAKMMAVGVGQFGMNSALIGQEVAEMMEGRARSNMTLFAHMKQFMGEGMTAGKFNALGHAEQWEKIGAAAEHFKNAIKEYAGTWDAISSTAQSYITNIIRFGSAGVFESLKQTLADVNQWYERNEQTILEVSRTLFDDLGGAIKFIIEMVRDSVEVIYDWMKYFGLAEDSAGAVKVLVSILEILALVMGTLIGVVVAITAVQWAWNLAMLANPIGLIVAAIAAYIAMMVVAIAKMEQFIDAWNVLRTDAGIRGIAKKMHLDFMLGGMGGMSDADAAREHQRAQLTMYGHREKMIREQGSDDTMAYLRRLIGMSNPAAAHGSMGNPMTAMQFALPGMDLSKLGQPDAKALLDKAGRPVTPHVTNIGAINLYNNIYDAEDPARVITALTAKVVREQVERPNQSPSVGVFR